MGLVGSSLVAVPLIVAFSALSLSGCGGGTDTATTGASSGHARAGQSGGRSGQAAAEKAHLKGMVKGLPPYRHFSSCAPGHDGSWMPGSFPAEILKRAPDPTPFNSESIWPQINGWHASDHRQLTAVVAGAVAGHKADGALGIEREKYLCTQDKADFVTVSGVGALRVTAAPEGLGSVQTWAQRHGNIQFSGESGVSGTLHLRDDTVTLNR